MKSFVVAMIGLTWLVAAVAAGSDEERLSGANLLKNSDEVRLYREAGNGTPTFVSGRLSEEVATGTELDTLLGFLERHQAAFRLTDPAQDMVLRTSESDDLGMRHVRLEQYYQGLRVMGGDLIGHFSPQGRLQTVNGSVHPDIRVDPSPDITAMAATDLARSDLEIFFGSAEPDIPELVIFPWNDEHYLCWRLILYSASPMGRWEYLVDAHSGAVVFKANRIMNANDIGSGLGVMGGWRYHVDTDLSGSSYQMRDNTRQLNNNPHGHDGRMPDGNYLQTNIAGLSLPGSIATDADNAWTMIAQTSAVDGHVYSGLVYDYMLHQLGRNGYDDNGASMLTVVNYSGEGDNNAYWDGSRMVVWSWSSGWRSLAGCPDVIAHEWGHAITEHCSNLVYQRESGALNESFSDMIGAAFEFFHDTLDTPDWLAGENAQISGEGFRDMENPHNFNDPDYYGSSDPYWVDVVGCTPSWSNDYCGVHTNSGVGNKWFYLLSDGGVHHEIPVAGIGVQNALLIAYRANRYYWTSTTDYHNAALGIISAANDLDTTGGWATQAAAAWNAVGVSTPGPMLVFSFPGGIPQMLSPYAARTFEVVVSGSLGGVPLAGTGRLFFNVDGSGWTDIPMTETSPNHYDATLPGQACGSTVEFYVRAQDAAMIYWYYPDTTSPNSAFPTTGIDTIFADNFESDLGWTVSGFVVDGDWDRGVPVGGGDRGDPATDFDGSGACYLTDNVDDNSDVDDGTTILTSPSIDLSGGDAIFHYARWYSNDFGANPNNDVMRVYLSGDNGSSWTQVDSAGPSYQASGGWYENSFWASEFVTPSSQMRLRFEVSDLSDPSVVEAGIDDVSVTVYACGTVPPVITTATLPNWTQGVVYAQQLEAVGGAGPLAWSDKSGDLTPSGLVVGPGGLVSGVPVAAGLLSFTAVVIDSLGLVGEHLFSFTINPAIAITATDLPDWTAGVAYSQQLTASGGTGAATWIDKLDNLAGTGLTLTSSGLMQGSPLAAGAISFTAQATDSVGSQDEKTLSVTINEAPQIITVSLPDGVVGVAYSAQLEASGGTGERTWSDLLGALSGTGLVLSPSAGSIMGTPAVDGPMSLQVGVTDSVGANHDRQFDFTIHPELQITTDSLPSWTIGVAYAVQLEAVGGIGQRTWADVGGSLTGTGLDLAATGLLSGIPLAAGLIEFTALVSGEGGSSDEKILSLTVNPEILFTTTTLPDWTQGAPYIGQLAASGGTGELTFSDKNADLAGSGLAVSSSGLLSGSPDLPGTISFTALAVDQVGGEAETLLSLVVNPELLVTTDSLPVALEGRPYSQQLAADGGTGGHTWSDAGSDLSGTGLSLSPEGLLQGTPLIAGAIELTAGVSDQGGGADEKLLTVYVDSAIHIITASLPDWTVGGPYMHSLSANGGWGGYTWSDRDGDLAVSGLELSPTGIISGIPLITGVVSFIAQASDTAGGLDEQSLSMTVNPAMELISLTLPQWTAGAAYAQMIVVSGGTPAIQFVDRDGDLVGSGLNLEGTGLVSGTPLTAGLISFTMRAADAGGDTLIHLFSIQVNDPVAILTTVLPDGKVGDAYEHPIEASGGTGILAFDDKNGDLVGTGLTLGSDGLLVGTPVAMGTLSFTARVTDSVGATAEHSFSLTIEPAFVCGDIDSSGAGPDISDLTYLVTYMFLGGAEPPEMVAADVDGSGLGPDIVDLTHLVLYMFHGGGPLLCPGTVAASQAPSGQIN
ncbi:MAG: M4 family metallopeptidase [bacterium]